MKKKKHDYLRFFHKALIVLWMLAVPFLLVGLILESSFVQTRLAKYGADWVSEKINTKVQINKVSISLFKGLEVKSVYLEDENKDTLAYIKTLRAVPRGLQISAEQAVLEKIHVDGLVFNLYEKQDSTLNLQFLLDAFASTEEKDTTEESSTFTLKCADIKVSNSSFSYRTASHDSVPYGMNFTDLGISAFNLNLKDFVLVNDSVSLMIDKLSLKDKCGFHLDSVKTHASSFSSKGVYMDSLLLKTNNSRVKCDSLNLVYGSWNDFSDFLNKVDIQTSIQDTTFFNFKDLTLFVPDLKMLNQTTIGLSGSLQGTVADLRTNKLAITYGKNTKLMVTSKLKGLPDIDHLSFDIKVDELKSSRNDIVNLEFKTDSSVITVPLPKELDGMGKISYKGRTHGTTYNFKSDGTLKSALGSITTLVRAKKDSLNNFNITGKLQAEHLKIGKILGNEAEFGDLTFSQQIDFSLLKDNKIKLKTFGTINNIILKNYKYTDVELYMSMNDMDFDSINLSIDVPDLRLDFKGRVNLRQKVPEYKFSLAIPHADLNALNLEKADTASHLSFAIMADMKGDSPDNISGELILTDKFKYVKNSLKMNLATFSLKSKTMLRADRLTEKEIILKSDFVDGKVKGRFKLESLAKSGEYMASSFLPIIAGEKVEVFDSPMSRAQNAGIFDFSFTLKNTKSLFEIFVPDLQMPNGAQINGVYNAFADTFGIYTKIPKLNYGNSKLSQFFLMSYSDKKTLETSVGFKKMQQGGDTYFENFFLNASTRNDSSLLSLEWDNHKDSAQYSALIKNTTVLLKDSVSGKLQVLSKFHPSELILSDSLWHISESEIFVDSTSIDITDFAVSSGDQKIAAFGSISKSDKDSLKVEIKDFQLASLAPITGNSIKLKGKMTGETTLKNLYKTPVIVTHDTINTLEVEGITLGEISLKSTWDSNTEGVSMQVYSLYAKDISTKYKKDSIGISGSFFPEKGTIDFNTEITAFKLDNVKPYFQDYLKIKKSSALYGNFSITGTTEEPIIKGGIDVKEASIIVKEINAKYDIVGSLKANIDNNNIKILPIYLNSGKGSGSAVLSGDISHKNFSDFKLDMRMKDIRNFQLLHTLPTDTSSFYGTVYADGGVTVVGPPDDLEINVSLKTRENTKLFVPMSTSSSVSESGNLLTFEKQGKDIENFSDTTGGENQAEPEQTSLYGMKINIDLEATPGAELQVIMDETTGDIMKAKGSGDIKLTINTLGDMEMSGVYTITEGDYLFTMKNLISKHFSIEKGGSIKWQGDPYNADLDLNAVYTLKKTSLYNLMLEEEYRNAKTKAECRLSMTGMLSEPELRFGIKLPPANDAVNTQIKNLEQDIINKQFLSLLLLNTFQPLPGLSQETVGGSPINTGEVVTNQLNHWLSQMSGGIDVGVNYQAGDEVTTDEFDVELSTQLWDDRVTINGNLGVGGNSATDPLGATGGTETGTGAPGEKTGNASGLVGDVEIEVKLNQSGSLKMKAFNQSNSDVSYDKGPYTQGVGVFWRKEFNTLLFWEKKQQNDTIKSE